ncbi:cytochrome P450 [Kitasatospora sp. NBC_00458]|uniref:cytochrome P450 n=1 Tax=Kitasatospora sp. NBC_00458 TaxID=2903568 RepID=UPI002E192793
MTDLETNSEMDFPIIRTCPFQPPAEYAEIRAKRAPVRARIYNGNLIWVITDYEDARAVLLDHKNFSSDITNPAYPLYTAIMEGTRNFPTLPTMDPPQHTAFRKTLISEFSVRRANELRPGIQKHADELIDAMLAGERPVDLGAAFATPLIERVTCELLGMSSADMQAAVAQSVGALMQQQMAAVQESGVAPDPIAQAQAAVGFQFVAMHQYFARVVAEKSEQPGDDMLSRLITRFVEPGELTRDQLANLAFVVFVAGVAPTTSMVNIGTATLLDDPEQLAVVKSGPGAVPGAVEELLRYLSVLDLLPRVAAADVEIGGTLIRKGEGVIVPNAAANRDERVFADPDKLDVTRPTARQHIAFGHGIHQCIGMNVARVQLEIAFETLFRRIPDLRLAVPIEEVRPAMPSPLPELNQLLVTW